MRTKIREPWLQSLGFIQRPEWPHGLTRLWDDGNMLQLVPDDAGWIVELWNGFEDVRARASFPRPIVYESELLPILSLMTHTLARSQRA